MNTEATDEKFNIVGLVVNCSPDSQDSVVEKLNQTPGVEVHAAEAGRLVTTLDDDYCELPLVDTITELNKISGVLATSIAYHHFDGMGNQASLVPANQEKAL